MLFKMLTAARRLRTRIAFGGVLLLMLATAAACGVASTFVPPSVAPTTAPSAPGKAVAPAAIPAASPAMAVSAAAPAPAASAAESVQRSALNQPNALPDTSAQILDRMVIRTAQLTVEIPDSNMEQALAQARAIATRGGGFVSASNTHIERQNDQDRMVADLTLQVRSDAADSALSDLRALGKVTSETSGSQDVTDEYVDLDSNLRNLQASESAILKLLDRANQIQDIISLERELSNVRGQIERIQGRKKYLERRTDMATITLSFRLPPVQASQPLSGAAWDPFAVAQRGWLASLTLLRGVAEAVIVAIAFSWWLVPIVALGAYVWSHRRRPTPPPAPAAPLAS